MKKILIVCCAILAFAACKDDEGGNTNPCLEEKLEAFKASEEAVSIRTQIVEEETHYWLNTNALTWDGVEYILNEDCDTICTFCGKCIPADCVNVYDPNNWNTIWEK
jgi:hypothetical protein